MLAYVEFKKKKKMLTVLKHYVILSLSASTDYFDIIAGRRLLTLSFLLYRIFTDGGHYTNKMILILE